MAEVLQIRRGHSVKVVCIENVNQGPAGAVTWSDELFEGVSAGEVILQSSLNSQPGALGIWPTPGLVSILSNFLMSINLIYFIL